MEWRSVIVNSASSLIEYLIESVELETSPIRKGSRAVNLDQAKFIKRIKLLERGIRKEFKVTPDEQLRIN
jgi:hypothetical protein